MLTIENYDLMIHGPMQKHSTSLLTGVNTCPRYGMVHGYAGKRMYDPSDEPMPLRAGSAAHRVFAAVRMYHLYKQSVPHFEHHAYRLFGEATALQMIDALNEPYDNEFDHIVNYALIALYNSGFIEDPEDKKRTMQNIEDMCVEYIRGWEFDRWDIYIEDINDPTSRVGVEIPFDVVFTYDKERSSGNAIRICGKIDGFMFDKLNNWYVVHENKTSSRITDVWIAERKLSWQTSTYCFAVAAMTGKICTVSRAFGSTIPLPKKSKYGNGMVQETVIHAEHEIETWLTDWIAWIDHTEEMVQLYKSNPEDAPMYSHSCGRYFRVCELMPFCASSASDRKDMLDSMATVDPLGYQKDEGETE